MGYSQIYETKSQHCDCENLFLMACLCKNITYVFGSSIFLKSKVLVTHYLWRTYVMETNKDKSIKFSQGALLIRQILYAKIVTVWVASVSWR